MSVGGSAQKKALQGRSQQRHDPQDLGGDLGGPVSPFVPGQQVSGEGRSHHQPHQKQSEPPVDLAGRTVGTRDHHLYEMEDQQHDHGVGGVVMQPPDEPAQLHLVLDEVDALPGRPGSTDCRRSKGGDR